MTKVLLLTVGKDIAWVVCCFWNSNDFLSCQNGILPPLFIGFNLNTSSDSLLLPVLHVVTLIPLSIDHVRPHNPSNVPSIASPSLCPVLPYFFHFVFFFFINNHWWRCWIPALSLKLWLHTSCQKILVEDIMNHPSFWKFQFKCS